MAELWQPKRSKPLNTRYYEGKTKRKKSPRFKYLIQLMISLLIFIFTWVAFQFDSPVFLNLQEDIRAWFTEDTDIAPVVNVIKKIGFYGDSFERAGYEIVSEESKPQATDPMTIPVSGTVVKPFGWTMVKGQSSFHKGITIQAPAGSVVKAAYAGTVLEIKQDSELGRVIVLSHKDGLVSTYGYCSEVFVKVDSQVKQGEVIAKISDTEDNAQGLLYYEINRLGEPINPMELLESASGI